ncbi:MAG TPA: hypothetical protein VK589_05915 [Chryseolinea sp.]|nr:hypothetical protein [Chryseolinea sp.]
MTNILYWGARLLAALILFQTLFFKFTASAESVYIFTKVGMEPWGRILVGILELVSGVMLINPRTAWLGAYPCFRGDGRNRHAPYLAWDRSTR